MYYSCSNIHKAFRRPNLLGVSRAPQYVQRCLHPVMPPCLDTNYRRVGSNPGPACWIPRRYPRKTYRILYSMIAMVVLGQSFQSNPVVLVLQVLSSYFLRKIPSRPKTTRSELIFHQLPHPVWKVIGRLCTTARSTTKTGAHCVRQRQS